MNRELKYVYSHLIKRRNLMNKAELAKIKEKALENHVPIIMDDTL